jgi:signal transduction histidine kinase
VNRPDKQQTIVVIDDDYVMRLSCSKILAKAGFRVETFEDGAQGLEGIARLRPDLVVVDLKMPGISGMEVISRTAQIDPAIIIVVITGYATISTAVETIKSGAYDFLPKPFSPDELRLIVDRGLERRRLLQETQRLEMERELLRRRFVTFVSHQLKTPLVAIHQYLDAMRHLGDVRVTADQRQEWIGRCLERSDEMLAIIKDWLSLSKVESGHLCTERKRIDLTPLIRDVLKALAEVAAAKGVHLAAELPENTYCVRGDRNSLSVLFDNLISNAIKYNRPNGNVTITGQVREGDVTISVTDTGIGIAPEDQQRLFDEFYRVKARSSASTSGTGLGLAICRRIVSELGGRIDVESEANTGSTFCVRLPACHEAAAL